MRVAHFFAAAVLAILSLSAHADYPDRPITLITPFGPGSGVDTVARILQPELEKQLGTSIVIKNVAGAGGQIGTKAIADADADGYTIGMSTVSTVSTNFVFKKQPYTLEDFSYVSRIGLMSRALVANQSFPAKDWKQFVNHAKANPNKYFYTTITNSVDMLDMHLITTYAGVEITPVPYPDNNAAFRTDFIADRIQVTYNSLPVLTAYLQSREATLLAITGNRRNPAYPDVPTFAELGLKELGAASFYGIVGPKNMSSTAINRLNKALAQTLSSPEVIEKLNKLGIVAAPSTPAEHKSEAETAYSLYTSVGKKLKIQAQ